MTKKIQNSKLKVPSYAKASAGKQKVTLSKTPLSTKREPQTMEELLAQTGGLNLGMKKGETVAGTVLSVTPKEVLADIGKKSFGIIANWELEQVKDYAATLKAGDKIIAQVINPENELGYTVLSVRKTSTERRWTILSEKKKSGEDLEVIGLEMAKGGLLVEWQGLRGFIPGTQIDSSYSTNPATLLGKQIKVKVLEVDQSLNRLVLSQKASSLGVSMGALKEKLDKIKANDTLKGVVSGIAPFGIFVDIEGLEGLVHISEIAWEKVENPASLFKVGDKVEVMVLDVNQNEGKLNLSIKRLTPDPWKNILDRYPPESTITGKVVRIAPYGVFVHVETGIEGLVHISKIPGGEEPKVGQELECIVEKVDPIKRKISLTLVPKEKPVGYR
ncbi:30S ribosomal protein S1 [Candidatus Gottesmanbacteria bacterium]|nr:30S ribosomal protein S1 [Candidatus Gottesmanbacteria bacterium]